MRGERADQFSEQAPGPRGSPHMPQGPADATAGADWLGDGAPTANTESCFWSSALAHDGHAGVSPALVRNSKRWPQERQAYSKSGMHSIVPQKTVVFRRRRARDALDVTRRESWNGSGLSPVGTVFMHTASHVEA